MLTPTGKTVGLQLDCVRMLVESSSSVVGEVNVNLDEKQAPTMDFTGEEVCWDREGNLLQNTFQCSDDEQEHVLRTREIQDLQKVLDKIQKDTKDQLGALIKEVESWREESRRQEGEEKRNDTERESQRAKERPEETLARSERLLSELSSASPHRRTTFERVELEALKEEVSPLRSKIESMRAEDAEQSAQTDEMKASVIRCRK